MRVRSQSEEEAVEDRINSLLDTGGFGDQNAMVSKQGGQSIDETKGDVLTGGGSAGSWAVQGSSGTLEVGNDGQARPAPQKGLRIPDILGVGKELKKFVKNNPHPAHPHGMIPLTRDERIQAVKTIPTTLRPGSWHLPEGASTSVMKKVGEPSFGGEPLGLRAQIFNRDLFEDAHVEKDKWQFQGPTRPWDFALHAALGKGDTSGGADATIFPYQKIKAPKLAEEFGDERPYTVDEGIIGKPIFRNKVSHFQVSHIC